MLILSTSTGQTTYRKSHRGSLVPPILLSDLLTFTMSETVLPAYTYIITDFKNLVK